MEPARDTVAILDCFVAGEIGDAKMVRLVGEGALSTNVTATSESSDHDARECRKLVEPLARRATPTHS